MRKLLVFQHVAHEILGTFNPLLKQNGFRVRYINFEREPEAKPSLSRYNGLVVLGGHMGVYEAATYPHIAIELKLIEEALKKNIPVFGICLGAQMIAQVLGGDVRRSPEKEIGWYDLSMTDAGVKDPLFSHFKKTEKVFQLHGDTFDIPDSAVHLASSKICAGQAFRYGEKVYALQFHLEVDQPMILRWLKQPRNLRELEESNGKFSADEIRETTALHIARSSELSRETFLRFIKIFGLKDRPVLLGTDHGKPGR